MRHDAMKDILDPILELEEAVASKALMRLGYEGLDSSQDITEPSGAFYKDPTGFALHKFAYYQCALCVKPYFGGARDCVRDAEQRNRNIDASELMCSVCSAPPGAVTTCAKHGDDYLEWKCRYCCSVAIWFCFGTTHFCEPCHNKYEDCQRNAEEGKMAHCPVGPVNIQLEGSASDCPLRCKHPPTGGEYPLGCGVCRNAGTF